MEKNAPKKLYGAHSLDNNSTCRLCKSVGDPAHRYNLFSERNSEILSFAEWIYGEILPNKPDLPKLICRPCERRVRNVVAFRNTIVQTQSALTKFKRCNKDSPGSVSHPSKSLKTLEARSHVQPKRARQRLNFMEKEVSYI